jgi:hypothetical protein
VELFIDFTLGELKMHKKARKIINYTGLVLILFLMQQLASKLGGLIANLFSYEQIDPQNLFVYISVHNKF